MGSAGVRRRHTGDGNPPAGKYTVDAVEVVRALAAVVHAPRVAVRNLYLQFLFAWLTGNGESTRLDRLRRRDRSTRPWRSLRARRRTTRCGGCRLWPAPFHRLPGPPSGTRTSIPPQRIAAAVTSSATVSVQPGPVALTAAGQVGGARLHAASRAAMILRVISVRTGPGVPWWERAAASTATRTVPRKLAASTGSCALSRLVAAVKAGST